MPTPTRTIVMTGATRGIGRRAAESILRQAPDAVLVLLARGGGAADLAESNPNVRVLDVDLAAPASIRTATDTLRRDLTSGALPPLTGVVANAGMQLPRSDSATEDGLETTFAVNVVANHVLVGGLRESLGLGARIVVTASDTHFGDFAHNMGLVPGPVWRDPDALVLPATDSAASTRAAGQTAYSTSKLAVIYWVHALARRLPDGVEIFSFNPGLVPGTGLARNFSAPGRFVFGRVMPLLVLTRFASTVATAGDNLAAALLDAVSSESGAYINGRRPERSSPESYDEDREETLWKTLERLAASA
jgi:NAD(P)-dependent dehydrogenase (short-subunit alcohol dehydrogenase family)